MTTPSEAPTRTISAPISPDVNARSPLLGAKKPAEGALADEEIPPLEQDEELLEAAPLCWCCPVWRCLFGGCCAENPQHPATRALDCVAHFMYWYSGMQHPGGTFRRSRFDAVGVLNDRSPGRDRATGVTSRDLEVRGKKCDRIPIRVYTPKGAEDPSSPSLPIMFYIHGGGFCIGSRAMSQMHYLCNQFSAMGMIVVSVSYRLAPEFPFPAGVEDCYDVLDWIVNASQDEDNRRELRHHNRSKIILAGDSAGGNLSCVLASLARDGMNAQLEPASQPIPITYLVMIYPALFISHTDPQFRRVYEEQIGTASKVAFIPSQVRSWFLESYIPGGRKRARELMSSDRRLAPLLFGAGGFPPSTLVSADLDILKHENRAAAEMLNAAGSKCKARHYLNVPHGFVTFSFLKESKTAIEDIKSDLREVLLLDS